MLTYINIYTQDRSHTQYICTYIPNIIVYFFNECKKAHTHTLIPEIEELMFKSLTHSSAHSSFSSKILVQGTYEV